MEVEADCYLTASTEEQRDCAIAAWMEAGERRERKESVHRSASMAGWMAGMGYVALTAL